MKRRGPSPHVLAKRAMEKAKRESWSDDLAAPKKPSKPVLKALAGKLRDDSSGARALKYLQEMVLSETIQARHADWYWREAERLAYPGSSYLLKKKREASK